MSRVIFSKLRFRISLRECLVHIVSTSEEKIKVFFSFFFYTVYIIVPLTATGYKTMETNISKVLAFHSRLDQDRVLSSMRTKQ